MSKYSKKAETKLKYTLKTVKKENLSGIKSNLVSRTKLMLRN